MNSRKVEQELPKNAPKKRRSSKFKSVVALANSKLSIKVAAVILSSSTLVSALLGIFRDRLLNSYYLDTYPTGIDAYTAAFTIPDFMFFILTSGALAVSFIPVFNERLVKGNKKSAWELSSSLINLFALITLVASILMMVFAEPLVRYVVGPGLDEPGTILAINMMRVIAINPFLMSIATVLASIQQAVGRFVFFALAPAVYNIGILIGITWFTGGINIFGIQLFDGGIMGVALGVVFGAVLQVIISLIGLIGLGFDYKFKIYWKNHGFKTVLKLLPARSLDQGIDYVNGIVNTNLSSRMGAGALRCYQQASSLHQMPVSHIGVAISTAYFPQLTEDVVAGKEDKFYNTFRKGLRMITWISLPVAVIAYFARGYVVSFIKNGGDALIANILGTLILAIFARSVFHIASRGFYAQQDTRTPFIISIVAVGLSTLLAVLFSVWGFGPEGLGWAQSIGAMLEIILLLALLDRRSNHKLFADGFWRAFAKMLFATVITGCVAYSFTKFFPLRSTDNSVFITIPKFALICLVSIAAYIISCAFLNLPEVKPILAKLKKILFKNI
ncbi:murein biosynthesis integral membrane protein MurJ [Candidatus Saccharibacteria bacterium]|nr:murein biosynthesis integral membrane protein MurJ [Candidatus Saccharibacteria bacterium]